MTAVVSAGHPLPVLYSFRRCPYAMRARLALAASEVTVELREIILADMPEAMLLASPKATVPVLVLADQSVIDESHDIMQWALSRNDPHQWLPASAEDKAHYQALLKRNDGEFKSSLDHYKYSVRFPERSQQDYRREAEGFLGELEALLSGHTYLLGEQPCIADYSIFPFIRQFAHVDLDWFEASPYPHLRGWLDGLMSSALFIRVMEKYKVWQPGAEPVLFTSG